MNKTSTLLSVLFLCMPTKLNAQVIYNWTNVSNSFSYFDVADNWSPNGNPGILDAATFSSSIPHEVWWDGITGSTVTSQTLFSGAEHVTFLNLDTTQWTHQTSDLSLGPEIFPLTLSKLTLLGMHLDVTGTSVVDTSFLIVDGPLFVILP